MEDIGTWRSPSGELRTESIYGAIVLQPRLSSMQNSQFGTSAVWVLPLRKAESAAGGEGSHTTLIHSQTVFTTTVSYRKFRCVRSRLAQAGTEK